MEAEEEDIRRDQEEVSQLDRAFEDRFLLLTLGKVMSIP